MASCWRNIKAAVIPANIIHNKVFGSVRWSRRSTALLCGRHVNLPTTRFVIHTSPLSTLTSRTAHTVNHTVRQAGVQTSWLHPQAVCAVIPLRANSSTTGTTPAGQDLTLNTGVVDIKALPDGYIPEPPPIPIPEVSEIPLNALGEPTLHSLGLCNNTPTGLFQWALENLHVTCDLPWWGTIAIATVCIRLVIFPLVIISQRNVAQMNNHMPTVQRLQERFSKARMSADPMEAAQAGHELMDYMKRNKVSPFKNMLMPLVQAPIFISVFVGLRQMANLPVATMATGGILWFSDLTIPDPIYALPVLTVCTLLATIELGVDTVRATNMTHTMKWVMRIMPLVIFPFIINFPAAMLVYWLTSNLFSLLQVLFLKIPGLKPFFKIPEMVIHEKSSLDPPKKKKFIEGFTETWNNSKKLASIEDRARVDAVKFKEAGMQPVQKTYSYDPSGKTKEAPKS